MSTKSRVGYHICQHICIGADMLRTTVYLDEEIALAIRQLAETERRTQADIIRDALRRYVNQARRRRRPRLAGVGAYHSGRADVSERAEKLLKDAARKSR